MYRLYSFNFLLIGFFLFSACSKYSKQEERATKFIVIANAYEEIGEYTNALEYYQQAFYLLPKVQWADKVGQLFLKSHQYKQGLFWFHQQFKNTNISQPLYVTYAQLLRYNNEHSSAKRYFQKSNLTEDEKAFWTQSCDSALYWNQFPKPYFIQNLGKLNSPYSDISPAFFEDGLVFSSSREGVIIRKKTGEQNQPYYNLYKSKKVDNQWEKPNLFAKMLNTLHHEGAVSFSEDFSEIYMTKGGTRTYKNQEIQYLKLYKSEIENGEWLAPTYFILNDSTASFGHPCLAFHDNVFLFASDLPNGYGGTDLYICFKKDNGWTLPLNLGPNINTANDELYPFVTNNGVLFFSSNGHIGMGGFDIYKSKLVDGEWTPAKNLEKPLNTSFDDFSFIVNDSTNIGYFSSNRLGGKGAEDIYEIEVNPSFFH